MHSSGFEPIGYFCRAFKRDITGEETGVNKIYLTRRHCHKETFWGWFERKLIFPSVYTQWTAMQNGYV
ncbi:MAG: hypothetical protein ACOC2E_02485 [Bacteroidota bacterium]